MEVREQYKMPLYKLKKDIPLCKKGTIFYYDKDDKRLGSIGNGCLKMAWTEDGNCQNMLCGDTIVFHANAIKDTKWFEKISEGYEKEIFVESGCSFNGEKLYRKIR